MLVVRKDGQTIRETPVDGELSAGRANECGVQLEDRAISREHAVFRSVSNGVQVEKKSAFGQMSVNGSDVTSAILKSGDRIELGPFELELVMPNQMRAAAEAIEEGAAQEVQSTEHSELQPAEEPVAEQAQAEPEQASIEQPAVLEQTPEQDAAEQVVAEPVQAEAEAPLAEPAETAQDDDLFEKSVALEAASPDDFENLEKNEEDIEANGEDPFDLDGDQNDDGLEDIGADSVDAGGDLDGLDAPAEGTLAGEGAQEADLGGLDDLGGVENGIEAQDAPADFDQDLGDLGGLDAGAEAGDNPISLDALGEGDVAAGDVQDAPLDLGEVNVDEAVAPQGDAQEAGSDDLLMSPSAIDSDMPENADPSNVAEDSLSGPQEPSGQVNNLNQDLSQELNPGGVTGASLGGSSGSGITGAETRVLSQPNMRVVLEFRPGEADTTEFEMGDHEEIAIGRNKSCHVVIKDKKSSRRHCLVTHRGANYQVKDLGSANGTYLNNEKLGPEPVDLVSDDVLRIGDTEFTFKAVSLDYEQNKDDFMKVSDENTASAATGSMYGQSGFSQAGASTQSMAGVPGAVVPNAQIPNVGMGGGMPQQYAPSAMGIPGGQVGFEQDMGGGPEEPPKGLLGKWKAMPKGKRLIYIMLVFAVFYFDLLELETEEVKKPRKPAATAQKNRKGQVVKNFKQLSKADQEKVASLFALAKKKFESEDYNETLQLLSEMEKIIPVYENSDEFRRYAEQGKKALEAKLERQERERREQEKLAKIRELEREITGLMKAKEYESASNIFPEILSIDPENKLVAVWKKEIDDFYEKKRQEEIERQNREVINSNGRTILANALAIRNEGKCAEALTQFKRIKDLGVSDPALIDQVDANIKECEDQIRSLIEPVLAEARTFEDAGDVAQSFKAYRKATEIDPEDKRGYQGMDRIKGILHEKAKIAYTEAIIAESYSDYETAKKKYQECVDLAPEQDVYHQRAKRKLKRFQNFGG